MKSASSKTTILAFAFLLSSLLFPLAPAAAQSGCFQEAIAWVDRLNSTRETILRDHAQSKCEFAAKWVKEIDDVAEKTKRERTCNDLVLVWTHKECIYFRDYVETSAYAPCKSWTRMMYRNCMSNDFEWFSGK
ncbi:hypothetical protein [Desulfopila inferna]|uniref:hypothetical protein n=1 Tax=Desulfopila inferna TaxID=468528 RepID=UPI001963504A|nr:hypothetical protein [Desulfopila inferna]MBM9606583.1 hypothetical protein [Desulfopila inferna]